MRPVPIPISAAHSFGSLSPELDALLKTHAKKQHLVKKQRLFHRGSPPDALFCVESGGVRLCVTGANGRESLLNIATPGHWFGEASVFTGENRIHDAFAVLETELLVVPAQTFHTIVDHRPEFLLEFLRLMGLRYKATLERMDENAIQPLPARLASTMLELFRAEITQLTLGENITLHVSQEDLGQMLGVSRQSVNKVLKEWEEQGFIEVSYRSLVVLQPAALETSICSPDAARRASQ